MTSLFAVALLLASGRPAKVAPNPDGVFARSDRKTWEIVWAHRSALKKAGQADDGLDTENSEVLGISHVKGEAAYKMKVHTAEDQDEYRWLDMKSFLELKRAPIPAQEKSAKND